MTQHASWSNPLSLILRNTNDGEMMPWSCVLAMDCLFNEALCLPSAGCWAVGFWAVVFGQCVHVLGSVACVEGSGLGSRALTCFSDPTRFRVQRPIAEP
jgi:hypothetical protein